MAIRIEVEPASIKYLTLKGWKGGDGILIEGERTRLPNWPDKVTFGGISFTCSRLQKDSVSGPDGMSEYAHYVVSR
jgi:hypothetical protein